MHRFLICLAMSAAVGCLAGAGAQAASQQEMQDRDRPAACYNHAIVSHTGTTAEPIPCRPAQ